MTYLTDEAARQIEEALHNVGNALMCLTATRKLRPMYQEMRDDAVDGCNKALSTIRAARAQADHIAGAGKVIGCAYCDNPLFAGTKCNNCGRVTLAEQAEQEPVAWHHQQCEGQCIACLIEKAVQDAYGTQGRDYMLRHINAAPVRTKDLTEPLIDELRECRDLLMCVESCSRNNFENLAYERVQAIDAVIATDLEKNK